MNKLTFYTDGGCEPNPGNGTWAFVCCEPLFHKVGAQAETTNNRMEIIAVLEAIKFAIEKSAQEIVIHSDSEYTVNAFNSWMHKWAKKGWKGKKNVDLFQELLRLKHRPGIKISLIWVRGHDGNKFNEIADELVRKKHKEVFGGVMQY